MTMEAGASSKEEGATTEEEEGDCSAGAPSVKSKSRSKSTRCWSCMAWSSKEEGETTREVSASSTEAEEGDCSAEASSAKWSSRKEWKKEEGEEAGAT